MAPFFQKWTVRKFQALEAIPILRESMNIDRAKMRVRLFVPSKNARNLHDRLKEQFDTVEDEDWEKGDLTMVNSDFQCKIMLKCQ